MIFKSSYGPEWKYADSGAWCAVRGSAVAPPVVPSPEKPEGVFVVRDRYGYAIHVLDYEPGDEELKGLCGLSPEADLGYATCGYGWESEDEIEERDREARSFNSI